MAPLNINIGAIHHHIMSAWPEKFEKYRPTLEDAQLCHQHYQHCAQQVVNKGRRIKVLMVAESSARTPPEILGRQILPEHQAKLKGWYYLKHNNLVHSISYGEDWLIRTLQDIIKGGAKNTGTPVFWKLLSVLAGETDMESLTEETFGEAFPKLKSGTTTRQRQARLDHKISILQQLENLGIVLIDLSPVSIYLGAGMKTVLNKEGKPYNTPNAQWTESQLRPIFKIAWEEHLKPMLLHYRPESVLVLGKRTINGIPNNDFLATLESIGATCLGHIVHPSSRTFQAAKYVPFLRGIHHVVRGQLHPGKPQNCKHPMVMPQEVKPVAATSRRRKASGKAQPGRKTVTAKRGLQKKKPSVLPKVRVEVASKDAREPTLKECLGITAKTLAANLGHKSITVRVVIAPRRTPRRICRAAAVSYAQEP